MNITLRSGTRQVIYNVYRRCLPEFEAKTLLSDLDNVYQRTAEMTGKSVSTVRRIVLEGDLNNAVFSTPGKHRKGRPKKELNDFDLCAIRQKVQFCYTVKKEVPTLRSLLRIVKEDLDFTGSREHLRKVLQALGFRYKKCQTERTALMEKTHIADKRESYLKIIMENRVLPEELRKDVVYLDESYVHSSYKLKKCWQSLNIAGVRENVSKGKRYIIVHAGSEKGFIPNALLIFSGKNKNEDYHSEMNATNFTKWVKEKLIPNLPNASIVVMDNAPYHSVIRNKAPTSNNNVGLIKQWLTLNNIPFDPTLRKPGLVMLLRKHKPKPIYEIDEILGEQGHTVVRLPPYHCDLNPIELIWGIAKHKIALHNVNTADIKAAAEQAFADVSVDDWKNSCQHVMKIEEEYYARGNTLYQDIDRLVINVQDDSTTDDTSDYSEVEYLEEEYLEEHEEISD